MENVDNILIVERVKLSALVSKAQEKLENAPKPWFGRRAVQPWETTIQTLQEQKGTRPAKPEAGELDQYDADAITQKLTYNESLNAIIKTQLVLLEQLRNYLSNDELSNESYKNLSERYRTKIHRLAMEASNLTSERRRLQIVAGDVALTNSVQNLQGIVSSEQELVLRISGLDVECKSTRGMLFMDLDDDEKERYEELSYQTQKDAIFCYCDLISLLGEEEKRLIRTNSDALPVVQAKLAAHRKQLKQRLRNIFPDIENQDRKRAHLNVQEAIRRMLDGQQGDNILNVDAEDAQLKRLKTLMSPEQRALLEPSYRRVLVQCLGNEIGGSLEPQPVLTRLCFKQQATLVRLEREILDQRKFKEKAAFIDPLVSHMPESSELVWEGEMPMGASMSFSAGPMQGHGSQKTSRLQMAYEQDLLELERMIMLSYKGRGEAKAQKIIDNGTLLANEDVTTPAEAEEQKTLSSEQRARLDVIECGAELHRLMWCLLSSLFNRDIRDGDKYPIQDGELPQEILGKLKQAVEEVISSEDPLKDAQLYLEAELQVLMEYLQNHLPKETQSQRWQEIENRICIVLNRKIRLMDRMQQLLDEYIDAERRNNNDILISYALQPVTSENEQVKESMRLANRCAHTIHNLRINSNIILEADGGGVDDVIKPACLAPIENDQAWWRYEPWGRILMEGDKDPMRLADKAWERISKLVWTDFEVSVKTKQKCLAKAENKLKELIVQLENKRQTLRELVFEVQKNNSNINVIENPKSKEVLEVNDEKNNEIKELDAQIEELERRIAKQEDEIALPKIALHATFLQRIIDKIGDRGYLINQLQDDLGKLQSQRDTKLKHLEEIDRIAALSNRIEEVKDEPADLTEEIQDGDMTHGDVRAKIAQLNGMIEQTKRRIGRYQEDVQVLLRAYEEQMDEYVFLRRPTRGFLELTGEAVTHEVKKFLTGGLYSGDTYITPDEFRCRRRFAEAGYCVKAGLNEWTKWSGKSIPDIINRQVQDFLDWADNYPDDAAGLATDIMLVIDLITDEGLKGTLTNMVNVKIYSSLLMGHLGRGEQKAPTIQRHHFRFRALADLLRYGPQAVAVTKAAKAGARQLIEGNFGRAIFAFVGTFMSEGYRGEAIQRLVDGLRGRSLQAIQAALQLSRGESMRTVFTHQTGIELLRLAGNARRIYATPMKAIRHLNRAMIAPINCFIEAKTNGERAMRGLEITSYTITALTVPGAVVTGVVPAATLFLVTYIVSLGLSGFTQKTFPETPLRVRRKDAEAFINKKFKKQLEHLTDKKVSELKARRMCLGLSKVAEAHAAKAIAKMGGLPNHVIKMVVLDLEAALKKRVEQFQQSRRALNDSPRVLQTNDVLELFNEVVDPREMADRIQPLLNNHLFHNGEGEIVVEYLQGVIADRLSERWLRPQLLDSFRNWFIELRASFNSEVDFEAEIDRRLTALNPLIDGLGQEAVRRGMAPEHLATPTNRVRLRIRALDEDAPKNEVPEPDLLD